MEGLFRLIQSCLQQPCLTHAYSHPSQVPSSGIFRTRDIFKTLRNFDQTDLRPCDSQNILFSDVHEYSEPCVTLAYAEIRHIMNRGIEPFHNCIPAHIQNLVIFMEKGKPCIYNLRNSEPYHMTNLEYSESWHI